MSNSPSEAERLQAIKEAGLGDLTKEERFDRVTRITRRLFRAPISLLSVINKDKTVFKSNTGLDESAVSTDNNVSFCAQAILSDEPLIVTDATKDPRFNKNPNVTGGLKVRFYVGQPIKTPTGQRIATLCVVDTVPREVQPEDLRSLKDMSSIVEEEIKKNFDNQRPGLMEEIGDHIQADALRSNAKDMVVSLRQRVSKKTKKNQT